jgi:hypothetical protein
MERARLEPAWPHRHWVLCLGVFCTIAGGQPEVAFVSLLAVLLYAVARWLRELSTAVRLYAPGAVAGLLLASPLTLPFVDYGWSASSGHGAGTQVGIMNASVWTAMGYLVPYLFGPIHAASLDTSMWFLAPGWMPAAVLFLALASCIGGRDRRPRGLTVLAAMTLLVAAKMWGAPGTDWLGGLPLFERIIYPRYASFLLTFGLAGMAAFGLVCLAGWTAREWRIAAGLWLAILVAVLAGATLAGRAPMPASHFALLGGAWAIVVPAGLWWVHTTYRGDLTRPGLAVAAATLLQAEAYLPGYSSYTYIGLGLGCLVLFAVIVAVIVATALTERGAGAVFVCAVVAAPPLGVALVLPDGLARRYDPLIRPPYLDTLERLQEGGRYRAYPIDSTPQPNFSAPFKLSTLSNLEVLLPQGSARFVHRYLDRGSGAAWFAGNYSGGRQPRTTALDEFRTNRRFFDLVATRHLVTHGASYSKAPDLFALEPSTVGTRGASPTALSLVYEDHTSVRIWENRQAVPRVFLASEVEIASSPADALARLERFADLTRRVAIETGEPLAPSSSPGPPGTLLSFVLAPDTVRIEYRADVPGILTMTDSYEEGWRARLDGVEAPVLRVNGVFRGIRLERPGRYRLEMRYRPPRWTISLVLAAGGVLMLVAASLSIRRRKS